MKYFRRFRKDQDGASLIEYALLVALIALVSIVAVTNIGTQVNTAFTSISSSLANAVTPPAK
ncbi:MAG: Flp family type IVb pilin [Alsobacter sp.]